jgi:hypothetical protein
MIKNWLNIVVKFRLNLMGLKHITMDFFGSHNGSFFLNESSIVALHSTLFGKLSKSEMKN